jgi:hypothetical protein
MFTVRGVTVLLKLIRDQVNLTTIQIMHFYKDTSGIKYKNVTKRMNHSSNLGNRKLALDAITPLPPANVDPWFGSHQTFLCMHR